MGIFTNRFYNNYNMQQPRYNRQIQYNNQQMQNNNQIQNNQPITLNDGVSLKPLTQEELEKINEEIRQNIENAKTQDKISNKDENIKALEDLIQDEKNSSIFYGNLSDRFYKDSLEKLSLEALEHNKVLKEYYRKKYGKNFEEKIITINQNFDIKKCIMWAIDEEIKSYDNICEILEHIEDKNLKIFYKIALKKLARINKLEYISLNL